MEGDSEQPQVAVEVLDVEEGEISDSASIEEITKEAFNSKQELLPSSAKINVNPTTSASNNSNVNNYNNKNQNSVGGTGARVWTMRDLYNYQITSRNYSGLYSLAWAQAVNNKPLDEVLVLAEDNSNNNSNSDNNNNSSNSDLKRMESECVESAGIVSKVVIDMEVEGEKEEGELEEGEIDLDSEVVLGNRDVNMGIENEAKPGSNEYVELEKKQFDLIKKELESLTAAAAADAEKSFDGLCLRLRSLVDNLQELVSESLIAEKDALVQLLFGAIQIVYSVFCSMNQSKKEQNRDILSRLLAYVTSLKVPLFSFYQLQKMEVFRSSMDFSAVSLNLNDSDKDKDRRVGEAPINTDSDVLLDNANNVSTCLKKSGIESMSTGSSGLNECRVSIECLKSLVGNVKHKGLVFPLLDLHKDHDADSLPSPTRETSPPLPFDKGFVLGHGLVKPEWPVPRQTLERENVIMHPNETDAVKAFSTYQQKFGRSSIFMSDKLPSPTPSEDGDSGDVDIGGEVSSSSIPRNIVPVNTSIVGQSTVSSVADMDIISGQGHSSARTTSPMTPWPTPVLKSSSAKSRDPRLRLVNSDAGAGDLNKSLLPMASTDPKVEPLGMMSSRKQKTFDEPVLYGPSSKRQRNNLHAVTGTGGWLEDRGTVGMQVKNGSSGIVLRKSEDSVTCVSSSSISTSVKGNGNEKFQVVGPCTTLPVTGPITSLPTISPPTSLPIISPPTSLPATGPPTSLAATGPFTSLPVKGPTLPVTDPTNTASLHSLLKDIAGNPSIWMNILKMEQLKSVDSIRSMTLPPNSNSILGAVPSIKVPPSNSPVPGHISAGLLKTPLHAISMEEAGKVRMKPRDPRRFLHNGTSQKGWSVGSDQPKINPAVSEGMTSSLGAQMQEDQLDRKPVSSNLIAPPDITRQFTTNLKNIADIVSASQASVSPPIAPQASSSQPAQVYQGKMKTKGIVSESSNLRSGIGLSSQEVTAALSRPQNAWGDVEHLFEGFDDQQKAAIQRERARRIEEQKNMFGARKLCLVLDLDHTLLNSAKFVEVDPLHDEMLRKKEEQDREKPHRHLFRFPHMGMWTKLRPGIWNFLEKASKLYELHLYTMGNKYYATEMAKLLDPKGELFAGRVLSRGDDGDSFDSEDRVPKSKDLEGVLGMESAVVIIDDSVRVWPHNKLNLIAVERYIYFPCSRRQFGLPGPSLLEIDHDERPEDGTLASSLAVIERIHEAFFAHQSLDEADVRNILASEQHKILAGCRILFSRVFPVGETNPHMHPLWQTAEQFGAVCTNQIDEQVTHVVANSLGTDKVNWAFSTGRFVVHPGWVEASALLYRRANEQDFAIKQPQ
ncbi:RNA polymerase II C-terminal domain phosphatase-like 3 [Forsythia ovata]|uniref:protein-serine/threonine phosphatase n=1 Tax=Forsythia ovata TaxID=205694 RepID=A0ABD1WCF8_9LAMI